MSWPATAGSAQGALGAQGAPAPDCDAETMDLEDIGAPQGAQRFRGEQQGPPGVRRHEARGRCRPNATAPASRGDPTSRQPSGGLSGAPSGGHYGRGLSSRSSKGGPSGVPRRTPLEAQLGVEVWSSAGKREAYLYNITQTVVQVNSSKEKKELFSGLKMPFFIPHPNR